MRWHKDPLSNDLFAGPYIAGKKKWLIFISVPKLDVIMHCESHVLLVAESVKSIRVAKILAKKELINRGARFYDEVRNKV